jgi:hypothetical protein
MRLAAYRLRSWSIIERLPFSALFWSSEVGYRSGVPLNDTAKRIYMNRLDVALERTGGRRRFRVVVGIESRCLVWLKVMHFLD